MAEAPLISVVIATYQPGDGLDRVIDSLDAQTLPQDRFEVVIVDDGSPDDTWERLRGYAATRANIRLERIPNSGWPSRPRNLATSVARGDYVLFMDHDDSLYPDALRRMAEYAAETHADVLSPKESKTSDAWWGMPALADGNVPNAIVDGGIDRLLPMVPHKLYRRAFLDEHDIRFPEARRQLWEDIYVNVEAYRHAERVAILADTPCYLWYSSETNNSKTYGPRGKEFWDRLEELFLFIDSTLDGPAYVEARRDALLHQWRTRVLTRFSGMLQSSTEAEVSRALVRAQSLQRRYIPEEWGPLMGKYRWARSVLIRDGQTELLRRLWRIDSRTAASVRATGTRWQGGRLVVDVEARWLSAAGKPPALLRPAGDRLIRALPEDLLAALPPEITDLSDTLPSYTLGIAVRDRQRHITWEVRCDETASWETTDAGVTPLAKATVQIDPATAALGAPLRRATWDLVGILRWTGGVHGAAVRSKRPAAGTLIDGRSAVSFRNPSDGLVFDLEPRHRSAALTGLAEGRQPSRPDGIRLPLPNAVVTGPAEVPARVRLEPWPGEPGERVELDGVLRAKPGGASIDVEGRPPAGEYRVAVRLGEGRFVAGRWSAAVQRDGRVALSIRPEVPRPKQRMTLRRRLGAWRRRLRSAVGRRVRRYLPI